MSIIVYQYLNHKLVHVVVRIVRILALLLRKTLLKTKNCILKCLKLVLFDCAINEKCCSVDGGQGICPLSRPHPREFDSLKVPTPGNLPSKNANAQGSAGGRGGGGARGRRWAQVKLADAYVY